MRDFSLSLPSKKYILPVRISTLIIIILHLSKLWKAKLSILCDVTGEAAGREIQYWSLLGVKGVIYTNISLDVSKYEDLFVSISED